MKSKTNINSNPRDSENESTQNHATSKLTLEDIKFQHLIRKIPSSRKAIPAIGYYQILSKLPSNFVGNERYLNGYLFTGYYHPTEPDFREKFKVPMLIWSFYNNNSIGPKEFTLDELVNSIVHVKEVSLVPNVDFTTMEILDTKSYVINWDVVDYNSLHEDNFVTYGEFPSETNAQTDSYIDANENELTSNEIDNLMNGDDLDEILLDEESIDWELEEIFWELNQPIDDEEALVFWETNQPLETGEIDWQLGKRINK